MPAFGCYSCSPLQLWTVTLNQLEPSSTYHLELRNSRFPRPHKISIKKIKAQTDQRRCSTILHFPVPTVALAVRMVPAALIKSNVIAVSRNSFTIKGMVVPFWSFSVVSALSDKPRGLFIRLCSVSSTWQFCVLCFHSVFPFTFVQTGGLNTFSFAYWHSLCLSRWDAVFAWQALFQLRRGGFSLSWPRCFLCFML